MALEQALTNTLNEQASLCGHYELVQLLLESGAFCDRGTWVGERAVYNALNNKIRNLLLSYDYSKTTDPLQPWSSHLNSLLTKQTPRTSDITCHAVSGASFELHRFFLAARSPYFFKVLSNHPEKTDYRFAAEIPTDAFNAVLKYIYLEEMADVVGPGKPEEEEKKIFAAIDTLCKRLGIEKLWESILAKDRRLARQRFEDEVRRAQAQVEDLFRNTVVKHKMVVDVDKVDLVRWPRQNAMFADCILRADRQQEELDAGGLVTSAAVDRIPVGPHASVSEPAAATGRGRKRCVLYPVHKAFLIRAPYFETMFSSAFKEAQESEHLHIIRVDCSPEVLEIVLTFLYTEKAEIPLELAMDVLYEADLLFLDKLKNKTAQVISTLGSRNTTVVVNGGESVEAEPINVYDVIKAAWDLKVQRLEDFVARYLADRLEDYIDEPEFSDLIQESANRIKARQETDTIELLDDIRYYLDERFRLRFEDAGVSDMIEQNSSQRKPTGKETSALEEEEAVRQGASEEPSPYDLGAGSVVPANEPPAVKATDEGAVQTLDGNWAEDEFDAHVRDYEILLDKIDALLQRLKLDA